MKLGLLGYPIDHSLSPILYRNFLGPELTSYEMYSCKTPEEVPTLSEFSSQIDGLSITSPYKRHFLNSVEIPDDSVRALGAINTIAFSQSRVVATNTDYLAVVEILSRYKDKYGKLQLLVLGDGAMAEITKLVAKQQGIDLQQFSRKLNPDFPALDLRKHASLDSQTIIVNSCSRDYIFQGPLAGDEIFWDYNYSFLPHEKSIPSRVKEYQDGREMLELQAKAAIKFWKTNI